MPRQKDCCFVLMNSETYDLETPGDESLYGEQEEDGSSGITSVSSGSCAISREIVEVGSKAKNRWRGTQVFMPLDHLLKNKVEPFYGWTNRWWLLGVVWVSCAPLLIVILGLRENWGTDARKICMENIPLLTKPTWTASYWRRDKVFTQ